jgi:hypothetical protein
MTGAIKWRILCGFDDYVDCAGSPQMMGSGAPDDSEKARWFGIH